MVDVTEVPDDAARRRYHIAVLGQSNQTLADMINIPKTIKANLDRVPFKTIEQTRAYEKCERQIQALEIAMQAIIDEMRRRVAAAEEAEAKGLVNGGRT